MSKWTCTAKYRDLSLQVTGYELGTCGNTVIEFSPDVLRKHLRSGAMTVDGLKLTKAGAIVDAYSDPYGAIPTKVHARRIESQKLYNKAITGGEITHKISMEMGQKCMQLTPSARFAYARYSQKEKHPIAVQWDLPRLPGLADKHGTITASMYVRQKDTGWELCLEMGSWVGVLNGYSFYCSLGDQYAVYGTVLKAKYLLEMWYRLMSNKIAKK